MNYIENLQTFLGLAGPPSKFGWERNMALPTVAVILDEFSTACFSPEANLVPIGPNDIEACLDHFQPEFLFCESAWRGNDYAWQHLIATSTGAKPKLLQLIRACRDRGIRTVFWNKEDPPHFDDFIETARHFDFIFTTEEALVPTYRKAAGHHNVGVLPFAAQPAIHKPTRVRGHREGNVVFAGQYFRHKFIERKQQMDYLFPAAVEFGFDIYSREQGGDERYRFPEEYAPYVRGSLPYEQMLDAYRKYKIFLNVNSVPSSNSMCARRVFELGAAKTTVLSSPTPAISEFYGHEEVLMASDRQAASEAMAEVLKDPQLRQRRAHRAWRTTLTRHTYRHRMLEIRRALKDGIESLPVVGDDSSLRYAAVCLVRDANGIQLAMDEVAKQAIPPVDIRLLMPAPSTKMADSVQDSLRPETTYDAFVGEPGAATLARELQELDLSCVIFSDDTAYGKHYAADLLLATYQTEAAVVGKRVTQSNVEPSSPIDAEDWPEDRETDAVLPYAWLARGTSSLERLLVSALYNRDELLGLESEGYASDRYNALKRSDLVSVNGSEWIV